MLKVLLISYGSRVRCYTGFILRGEIQTPVEIVGVVEPNEFKRNLAKKDFNLPDHRCYTSLEEVLKEGKIADCAINGTMDQLHYETTMPLLEQGYHVLLEKPMCVTTEEAVEIMRAEKKSGKILSIGVAS